MRLEEEISIRVLYEIILFLSVVWLSGRLCAKFKIHPLVGELITGQLYEYFAEGGCENTSDSQDFRLGRTGLTLSPS